MRISYINLDRDIARRAALETQLAALGLTALRIAALTPDDIAPAQLAANCDPQRPVYVAPAELACTLSHHKAWRALLDSDAPHGLFLEDDVLLSTRLPEFLERIPPVLTQLDLLRVETYLPKVRLGRIATRIEGLADFRKLHSYNYGAGGYILTRRGAERLLGQFLQLDMPVDDVMTSPHAPAFGKLRALQAVPAPVANGPVLAKLTGTIPPSNLSDVRTERRELAKARKRASIRPGLSQDLREFYIASRSEAAQWFNQKFRGVEKVEIPLL